DEMNSETLAWAARRNPCVASDEMLNSRLRLVAGSMLERHRAWANPAARLSQIQGFPAIHCKVRKALFARNCSLELVHSLFDAILDHVSNQKAQVLPASTHQRANGHFSRLNVRFSHDQFTP